MTLSTSTDDGTPIHCEICGTPSLVNVSRPPGDSVCPVCGSFLWVTALAEVIRQNSFVPDAQIARLNARLRDDALREMSTVIADELLWSAAQKSLFVDTLIKREDCGTTAIGNGIALPHARMDGIQDCFTVIALAPEGISYNAPDARPVHTIIMMALNPSRPSDYLQLLESISGSLHRLGNSQL